MAKVFFVEDDDSIRDLVLYALRTESMEVAGFESGAPFFAELDRNPQGLPDLVLLDIMLPGEDGMTILKKLRRDPVRCNIPIIMVTAKGSEFDRIKGLDLGADDYIVKPFSMLELVSRIKALLRRTEIAHAFASAEASYADQNKAATLLSYREISVDTERHSVTVSGEPIELTFKEFELLCYMMRNSNIVLSRDRMMDNVWGFDYQGESRTVDMHINTLRRKLGRAGRYIKTIRSVGYKLGE